VVIFKLAISKNNALKSSINESATELGIVRGFLTKDRKLQMKNIC
jgi:hypothetical protein